MDFDHRAPPLAPPPRSDGDLEGRPLLTPPWKKRRSSADPHTPTLEPPKNRARSGMFDGADNVLTGAFPTPSPRKNQFGGPFDLHPQRRACLFAPPPPPPRRRAFFGPFDGCEYGDEDKRSASFPAPPPPPPRRQAYFDPFEGCQNGDDGERSAALPAPPLPPPRRPTFFNPFEGCQDSNDGERSSSFPAPPLPKGPALIDLTDVVDDDGDGGEPSASFPAPPPPKGPAFVDLTDVVDDEDGEPSASFLAPPPPRGPAFVDLTDVVDDEDGDDDGSATIVIPPAPTRRASGPFEPVTLLQPRDGGRSSSRGRGRGRGRGVCGGRGRGVAAGPGSRARALAELIGDREPVLTPDGGPAPGQDLEEWELLRDLALNTEYEYLDGLLNRLKEMPKRINATTREGWTVFYTGLETCLVVRKQMLKAKCNPTPVPDQFMAEAR